MSAFGDPRDPAEDGEAGPPELPERIIVVHESDGADPEAAAAELDALAAEVAAGSEEDEPDRVPTFDIDAPSDPDELRAELDAPAAEVGAEPIDLDELDLRAPAPEAPEPVPEEAPLIDLDAEADEASLDRLTDDDKTVAADAESLGHLAPSTTDPEDDAESLGHIEPLGGAVAPVPEDAARGVPGRGETDPGTLRPLVPEPVIAARRTSSPSRARRTVSRLRALVGLVVVVVLAGVGLAGAIGGAVLLVVLVLSRAVGSGG